MSQAEEWDWPPPPRGRATQIEGRIVTEQITMATGRGVPKSNGNRANRTANAFGSFIYMLVKVAVALAIGGVLFTSLALIGAIVRA